MTTILNFRKNLLSYLEIVASPAAFQWICLAIFLLNGIIFTGGLQISPYHDEGHFLENIILFSQANGIDVVRDYPEVTPPLFYFLYAFWGKLTSLGLPWLRLLSLIISLLSLSILGRILEDALEKGWIKNTFLVLLVFNPYFWGSSFLIYTDILGLFFIVAFIRGIQKGNPWILFIAVLGGLLTRQYLVFLFLAGGVWFLLNYSKSRNNKELINAGLILLSTIPLISLFMMWGGFAPPSGIEKWAPDQGIGFHAEYLTVYLSFIPVYLFPLFLFSPIKFKRWHFLIALACLLWYYFFPVAASEVANQQMGIETVGLVHKILVIFFGFGMGLDLLFLFLFFLGTSFVIQLLRGISALNDFQGFLGISLVAFLLIMPFSYQVWEKYLISVIPVFLLLLGLQIRRLQPPPKSSPDQA